MRANTRGSVNIDSVLTDDEFMKNPPSKELRREMKNIVCEYLNQLETIG